MHFVLVYKWRFLPKCLIDGFYPDWWRLLPVLWSMATSAEVFDGWVLTRLMATSAKIWVVTPSVFELTVCPPSVVELMGCYPFGEWINGLLLLQCCDYWALPHQLVWIWALPHQLVWKWIWIWALPHRLVRIWVLPHLWFGWRALPRQCFDSSLEMLPPIKNAKCLYCDVGLLPFRTCPSLSQRSYHPAQARLNGLTIILSYEFHTCSFIHAYTTCLQISFMHGCIVSLILIVQKVSSMMCLSQKCYQSCIFQVAGPTKTVVYQRLFHFPSVFPSVVVTPLR